MQAGVDAHRHADGDDYHEPQTYKKEPQRPHRGGEVPEERPVVLHPVEGGDADHHVDGIVQRQGAGEVGLHHGPFGQDLGRSLGALGAGEVDQFVHGVGPGTTQRVLALEMATLSGPDPVPAGERTTLDLTRDLLFRQDVAFGSTSGAGSASRGASDSSSPNSWIRPRVGRWARYNSRNKDVLPAPDGPTSAVVVPAGA